MRQPHRQPWLLSTFEKNINNMKISEPKFLLKDPKSDKETLISLFVRFNGERVVYSTGESIHPNKWDFENQRAKSTKKDLASADINDWLDKIEKEVKHIFRTLKYDGIQPTTGLVKQELNKILKDQPVEAKMSLFKFIENYIQMTKAIRSHSTFKSYRTLYNHLVIYTKLNKTIINFENIDLSFFSYFTQFLIIDRGLSQNTVAKHIKTLKIFLNAATDEGFNTNMIYKSKKFRAPFEEVKKIYLNELEIDKIYNLDLSDNPKLDRVRDLFIIGCSTGLRFNDFNELKPANIEGGLIRLKTQKTGEVVAIPLGSRVKAIFQKYGNNFPSPISNQKMNNYIKDVGALAGINELIIIRKSKGGQLCDQTFKKYELISSHCARRSFATNGIIAGLSPLELMKFTGHKTDKVFQNYVRFSQEENATKLKDHSFFNR